MVAKNILSAFGVFAFRFICKKVDLLVQRHGFRNTDREDLLQSFALNLHSRSAKFNNGIASWEAFVVVVCENHVATLLEHHLAEMRSWKREEGSLDASAQSGNGRPSLNESQHGRRTGRRFRSSHHMYEMQSDVDETIRGLTELQRQICTTLLRHGCVSATARELELPRSLVIKEIARIRERFEQVGLRAYL